MRRFLLSLAVVALGAAPLLAAEDTPAAAKTRKNLKQKVTVNFKNTRMKDAFDEFRRKVDKVAFRLDNEGGVSNNSTVTFSAKNETLEKALDAFCTQYDLGYVVVSDEKSRYDGWVFIKKGKERGYPAGVEPAKDASAAKDKPDKDKPAKDKDKPSKDKPDADKPAKDKPDADKPAKDKASKDKPDADKPAKDKASKDKASKDKASKDKASKDKPEDDGDKAEVDAARKLKLARMLDDDGLKDKAKTRYQDIIKLYPNTKAAKQARELLEKLNK